MYIILFASLLKNPGFGTAGTPHPLDRAGIIRATGEPLFPFNFLGILVGRDGANCILHHRNRHSHRLCLLSLHFKGPNLPRPYEEALPL